MKHKLFLIVLSLFPSFLYSQQISRLSKDSIQSHILEQILLFPQEKSYLQSDKSVYVAGEKIWFRVHLVDAVLHKPSTLSRYVYVELINPIDSVVNRIKIKQTNGAFSGYIALSETLPEGDYTIRCYTDNLRSLGSEYFFHRNIKILSPLSDKYRLETNFTTEGDKILSKLSLLDLSSRDTIKADNFTIRINDQASNEVKVKKDGVASVAFRLPEKDKRRILYVESSQYRKYVTIPNIKEDYDLSFYPEGGYLLNGVSCVVAFKALHSDGSSANIKGHLVDNLGNDYGSIENAHEGMGSFSITPQPDKKYYAVCENDKGEKRTFELPQAQKGMYSLHAETVEGKLYISVLRSSDIQSPFPLYLVLHTRGMVCYAAPWDEAYSSLSFDTSKFPSGVMQILLLDQEANPLSERLYFCKNDDQAKLYFVADKNSYGSRKEVKASVKLTDDKGLPQTGSFSISVTDNSDVLPDSTTNILSTLLLSSDLKGFIADPGFYFREKSPKAITYLDLLMLTHGWRRYNIPDVIKRHYEQPTYPVKNSAEITGSVRTLIKGKPIKKGKVSIFSRQANYLNETETDSLGHFIFNGFEAPDSTRFILQALTKKGSDKLELLVDKETFPTASTLPLPTIVNNTPNESLNNNAVTDYIEKSNHRYTMENGMRVIQLGEVKVTAKRIEHKDENDSYYMPKDGPNVLNAKEIEDIRAASLSDILRHFPFVSVEEVDGQKKVFIERMKYTIRPNENRNAALIVNDMIINDYDIDNVVDPSNIQKIGVLKGTAASMLGGDGAGGAIVITTKNGFSANVLKSYNIKGTTPLGLQTPIEFYSPKYETKEQINNTQEDFRTTIYWNPNVVLPSSGEGMIDFYTSDAKANYSIIIEGVTTDGRIIQKMEKIKRN
jgi:hypothetical protein